MSNDSHPWRSALKWCIHLRLIVRLLKAVAAEQHFGWEPVIHLTCTHALQLTFRMIPRSPAVAVLGLAQSPFKTMEKSSKSSGLSSLRAGEKLSLCEFLIWVSQTIRWGEHIKQGLLDVYLPLPYSELTSPKAELSLIALQLGDAGKEGKGKCAECNLVVLSLPLLSCCWDSRAALKSFPALRSGLDLHKHCPWVLCHGLILHSVSWHIIYSTAFICTVAVKSVIYLAET